MENCTFGSKYKQLHNADHLRIDRHLDRHYKIIDAGLHVMAAGTPRGRAVAARAVQPAHVHGTRAMGLGADFFVSTKP